MSKLTAKQEKFCYEYVIDLCGTQAAIRAGYSQKTAHSIASRMLRIVEVQKFIQSLQADLEKTAGITALRVLKEHEKIAFSSISHLHNTWVELKDFKALTAEQKACIKSISTKVLKRNIGTKEEPDIVDVEFVKIELYDKQKALDSIASLLGLNQQIQFNNQSINIVWNEKRYGIDEETK
jgi:phage terminase small subunit